MAMRLSVMVMGVCMAMSAIAAHAAVYKWTDANGRVHYGDQPGKGAVEVNASGTNGSASQDAGDAGTADPKRPDTKQKKAEECSNKRDQLGSYRAASKIVETDSLGNQKEFNDEERKKLIERTQKQLVDNCGDSPDATTAK